LTKKENLLRISDDVRFLIREKLKIRLEGGEKQVGRWLVNKGKFSKKRSVERLVCLY